MVVVVARVLSPLWPLPVLLGILTGVMHASAASELAPLCTLTVLLLQQPVQAAVSLLQHAPGTPAGFLLPALVQYGSSRSGWWIVNREAAAAHIRLKNNGFDVL